MKKTKIYSVLKIFYQIIIGPVSNNFSKKNPLLILAPAKTGSTSVYKSLKKIEHKSIFKLHFVSKIGFNKYRLFINKNVSNKARPHIIINRILLRKMMNYNDNIFIIVTIRNPIDQRISSIFQSWENHNLKLFSSENDIQYVKTLEFVSKSISEENPSIYIEDWFKNEIETPFNIDVFTKPYSEELGYTIYKNGRVTLLLMKMETMNNAFENAIKDFLSTNEKHSLLIHNIGEDKIYKESYKLIKENIKIEKSIIEEIVDSKYFTHFYSKQKDLMYKRWSK